LNPPLSLYRNSRFVEVGQGSDRVRLCVAEFPPASPDVTRRVLLIHGNPSHMDHWAHTVPVLQSRAAVLAYDQAGFGRSNDFADRRPTLERSVALATGLLDHAAWGEVDVIGHSHGCLVAIAMAAMMPERVRSLVLLASGGFPAHPTYRLLGRPGVDHAVFALGKLLFGVPALAAVARWVVRAGAAGSFAPDPVPVARSRGARAPRPAARKPPRHGQAFASRPLRKRGELRPSPPRPRALRAW
jgi:pimeloyl-ACP methyl ester carboxylesterase